MGRRRYDRQRLLANEMRRLKLAGRKPWIIGPYYRDEFHAELDMPMGNPMSIEAARITAEREARQRPFAKLCSNGRCTVVVDKATGRTLYSMGPAGCCDE